MIRLPHLPRFPASLPLQGFPLAGLCAIYLLAGLIGHDPWKSEDAIHFGVVFHFLNNAGQANLADWLIPRLAGELFLDYPPLYYWIAAGWAKLLGGLLPLHDAARLASGLFGAIFLALLAAASRALHEQSEEYLNSSDKSKIGGLGSATILIAIGCMGLLVPIHDTQPIIALLAASAATYLGLARLPQRPLVGGIQAGLGLGCGFLATGLSALLTLAPLFFLLPLHPSWRNAASLRGIGLAIAVATPLIVLWPLLLAWQTPALFNAWWAQTVSGFHLQSDWVKALPNHAELLGWFAWPALPLAFWTLWALRQRLGQPALSLPLLGSVLMLGELIFIFGPRPLYALSLLVPLILLASAGAGYLRRGAANAFDWFGMMTFTLVAGLLWIGGTALTLGIPARLAARAKVLEPGFTISLAPLPFAIAILLTLAWLWLIFASPRSTWRAIAHWAAGVTLMWSLLVALWQPWIDYGKSYRSFAVALKQAIPVEMATNCIAGRNLGGAQRLSLQYFSGIITVRAGTRGAADCSLLLEQGSPRNSRNPTPSGWHKVWEGQRPGDRGERFRLYQRDSSVSM